MKRIALWVVGFTIAGSTTTVVTITPDDYFIGALVTVIQCSSSGTVALPCVQGPPAPVYVPIDLSTGPITMKSSTNDCFRFDKVNPNGTIVPQPGVWMPCPSK